MPALLSRRRTVEKKCVRAMQPSVFFLVITVFVTTSATTLLCVAVMTDYWEIMRFDHNKVEAIAQRNNTAHKLEWLFDGLAAKITISHNTPSYLRTSSVTYDLQGSDGGKYGKVRTKRDVSLIFLVPMHGGIWTLCVSLGDEHRMKLKDMGFTQSKCINYLSPDLIKTEEGKTDWQHRMQNLSISCALVCLILLGASALVGIFGIVKHQISAVLITGVMYLLAAIFAIFTLTIIHFKRKTKKDCGVLDAQISPEYYTARIFTTGWSLDVGWGGVSVCLLASLLWILLSKTMRFNPLSFT